MCTYSNYHNTLTITYKPVTLPSIEF